MTKVKFWMDMFCGDKPLSEGFPILFSTVGL